MSLYANRSEAQRREDVDRYNRLRILSLVTSGLALAHTARQVVYFAFLLPDIPWFLRLILPMWLQLPLAPFRIGLENLHWSYLVLLAIYITAVALAVLLARAMRRSPLFWGALAVVAPYMSPLLLVFLRKSQEPVFGSRRQQAISGPDSQPDNIVSQIRAIVEKRMDMLRYLCTCEKFDPSVYFSMLEQKGIQVAPKQKREALKAAKSLDAAGLGYLRGRLVEYEFEKEISPSLQLMEAAFPEDPDVKSYLERTLAEIGELADKLATRDM